MSEKPKTIGRGEKCDVVLEDDRSSTKHCKIFLDHNRTYLVDVGSKNGTYVNDKKIEEAERIYLRDKILIGKTKLELIREEMTPVEKTYHIRPREGVAFTLPEMSSQNMESIDWTDGQKKEEDDIKKKYVQRSRGSLSEIHNQESPCSFKKFQRQIRNN